MPHSLRLEAALPLRLLEAHIAERDAEALLSALPSEPITLSRYRDEGGGSVVLRVLVRSEQLEEWVAALEARSGRSPHFRVVVIAAESVIPRQAEGEDAAAGNNEHGTSPVNIEELYEDVGPSLELSLRQAAWMSLSIVVAAAGFVEQSVAVLIGAMIIAPMFTPIMALALASALGDLRLAWRAVRVTLGSLVVGGSAAALIGWAVPFDPTTELLLAQTHLGLMDVAVALAAGCIGTLSLTTGIQSAQVGVMVAVATLPPLTAAGMLFGAGRPSEAGMAGLLLLTNLVGINLAGLLTLLAQRVHPRHHEEEERARLAVRAALLLGGLSLAALAGLILLLEAQEGVFSR